MGYFTHLRKLFGAVLSLVFLFSHARATITTADAKMLCKLLENDASMLIFYADLCGNGGVNVEMQRTSRSIGDPKTSADPNFLRFGRAANVDPNFLRFGRAADPNFLRFGKSTGNNGPNFLRFGKRAAPNTPNANFLRFGRHVPELQELGIMERESRDPNPNFLRFGR